MSSNGTHTCETVATEHTQHQGPHSPRRRRLSWRTPVPQHSDQIANTVGPDPHTALLLGHDHDGLSARVRQRREEDTSHDHDHTDSFVNKSASTKIEKMIAPYLAQHIPQQYNPLGGGEQPIPDNANTKYCYRHRPDMLCRKQADEPTMEQLQKVCHLLVFHRHQRQLTMYRP